MRFWEEERGRTIGGIERVWEGERGTHRRVVERTCVSVRERKI
jgi:hypothetical protein